MMMPFGPGELYYGTESYFHNATCAYLEILLGLRLIKLMIDHLPTYGGRAGYSTGPGAGLADITRI